MVTWMVSGFPHDFEIQAFRKILFLFFQMHGICLTNTFFQFKFYQSNFKIIALKNFFKRNGMILKTRNHTLSPFPCLRKKQTVKTSLTAFILLKITRSFGL